MIYRTLILVKILIFSFQRIFETFPLFLKFLFFFHLFPVRNSIPWSFLAFLFNQCHHVCSTKISHTIHKPNIVFAYDWPLSLQLDSNCVLFFSFQSFFLHLNKVNLSYVNVTCKNNSKYNYNKNKNYMSLII